MREAGERGEVPARERMPAWVPRLLLLVVLTAFLALLGWHLLGRLTGLLRMLALSLFLSFAFEPAADWLAARGWRRGLATGAVLAATVLVGLGLVALMVPVIVSQVQSIVVAAPDWLTRAASGLHRCCGITVSTARIAHELQAAKSSLATFAADVAGNLLGFGAAVLGGIFQLFTVGLFTFYLVAEGPKVRRGLLSLLTPAHQREVLRTWEIAIQKTGGYFYSRLLLAVINGGLTFAALELLRVPFALPLAVFQGVISEFIPMVGTYVAAAIPLFVSLVSRPIGVTVGLFAYFIVYQQLENYVLSPRLSKRTMELHPAVAFAAAITGASLGGVLWAFLALPAAATIQAAASAYVTRHEVVESELTSGRARGRPREWAPPRGQEGSSPPRPPAGTSVS